MMSSICQAMTRVSGGVAACTAENEVAMVVAMAAASGEGFQHSSWLVPLFARCLACDAAH